MYHIGDHYEFECYVFAGLAGVYHIGDHYEFESGRGIEDISVMSKAMYGPENFERFSPVFIVQNLPKDTRFVTIVFSAKVVFIVVIPKYGSLTTFETTDCVKTKQRSDPPESTTLFASCLK